MCWPDILESGKRIVPTLGIVGVFLCYGAIVAFLLWAPKIHKRWLRISCRVFGLALVIPVAIALPAFLLGVTLVLGNPPTQVLTVMSNDGQRAELNYSAGLLGRDHTEVKLKSTGSCAHTTVFWHAGPSDLNDPTLLWSDNHHLQIVFHSRQADPQGCEHYVRGIAITCTPLPWPDYINPSPGSSPKPK